MGDARRQLAERSKFFGLDQAILGSAEIFERLRQFLRSSLLGFEQASILDGNRCLIGEGLYQRNLLVVERPDDGVINQDHAQ